jgi:hypothetical protein
MQLLLLGKQGVGEASAQQLWCDDFHMDYHTQPKALTELTLQGR